MNGVADDSDSQMYYEEHETFAVNDGHMHAKGPPVRPFHSVKPPGREDQPNNGGILSRLFRKKTVDQPVQDPQLQVYACRWPGCKVPVSGDRVGRLGGFCCVTHMW